MLSGSRVRHTVAFSLHHAPDSAEETSFLDAIRGLSAIDVVEEFELLREVSAKNDFRFALSMEFADRAAYDGYDADPRHVGFVRDRWVPEVAAFQEIDHAPLP